MRKFLIFSFLLITGFAVSCTSIKGTFLQEEDTRRLLAAISEKAKLHRSLLLHGIARVKFARRSVPIKFYMILEKPDKFRFDGIDTFGNTIISASLKSKEGIVCLPWKKTAYKSKDTERLIKHFTGVRVTVDDFVSIFMNDVKVEGKIFESFRIEKDGYIITARDKNSYTYFVYKISDENNIRTFHIEDEHKSAILETEYLDFKTVNGISFPQKIIVKIPSYGAGVELGIDEIQMDVELSDDSFSLIIPDGIKTIDLDEKI